MFKYPLLNQIIKAKVESNSASNMGVDEALQMAQAWENIKEEGIANVDVENLQSLCAKEYSAEDLAADAKAADWDIAFAEVEAAEKLK